MMAAFIVKWTIVTLMALSALGRVALIGEPRKPITPGEATGGLFLNVPLIVAVILTWDTTQ